MKFSFLRLIPVRVCAVSCFRLIPVIVCAVFMFKTDSCCSVCSFYVSD